MNTDAPTHELAGRAILVVEDEYLIAELFVRALTAVGVKVLGPAPTVAKAQAIIAETEVIDCAVLDVNLRGDKVWPVVDLLRAAGVPVVLATGSSETSVPERYQDLQRCSKPVDLQVLSSALRPLFDICK